MCWRHRLSFQIGSDSEVRVSHCVLKPLVVICDCPNNVCFLLLKGRHKILVDPCLHAMSCHGKPACLETVMLNAWFELSCMNLYSCFYPHPCPFLSGWASYQRAFIQPQLRGMHERSLANALTTGEFHWPFWSAPGSVGLRCGARIPNGVSLQRNITTPLWLADFFPSFTSRKSPSPGPGSRSTCFRSRGAINTCSTHERS